MERSIPNQNGDDPLMSSLTPMSQSILNALNLYYKVHGSIRFSIIQMEQLTGPRPGLVEELTDEGYIEFVSTPEDVSSPDSGYWRFTQDHINKLIQEQ